MHDVERFEGDMVLEPVQRIAAEFGLNIDVAEARGSTKSRFWPNGIVPYIIDASLCKQYS